MTLKTIIHVQPAWRWFCSKWTYMLWSGSSKPDDSIEPEYRVWKQLLIRKQKKSRFYYELEPVITNSRFHFPLSSSLTLCLISLDVGRWPECGTGLHTSWDYNKVIQQCFLNAATKPGKRQHQEAKRCILLNINGSYAFTFYCMCRLVSITLSVISSSLSAPCLLKASSECTKRWTPLSPLP